MKKIFIVFIFIITIYTGYSQSIRIIRADVDSLRSHFITATYSFGIDIITENVDSCNGVTFELKYNQTAFVKLSEATIIDIGKYTRSIILPFVDTLADEGKLAVGVLSDDTTTARLTHNPRIIHVEFVVLPNAPHNTDFTFSFSNANAIIKTDTGGYLKKLDAKSRTFKIRGFVDVWPGDADNNGVVDIRDVSTIGLFINNLTAMKSNRRFKRANATTQWSPQTVLAWDSLSATFADCDGNGDITVSDILIIPLNYNKTHALTGKSSGEPAMSYIQNIPDNPGYKIIPVYISPTEYFIGASGSISIPGESGYRLVGITPGNCFDRYDIVYFNLNTSGDALDFALGTYFNTRESNKSCVLFKLVFEPVNSPVHNPEPEFKDMTGLSPDGFFFPLLSSVSSNPEHQVKDNNITVNQSNNLLVINTDSRESISIRIFDLIGREYSDFTKYEQSNGNIIINTGSLKHGIYYLELSSRHFKKIKKIIVE